jgi:hypothetical protein
MSSVEESMAAHPAGKRIGMVRYLVIFTLADETRVEYHPATARGALAAVEEAWQSHARRGNRLSEVAQVEARPTLNPVEDLAPHPLARVHPICVCGDLRCDCACIPGGYPCEHGTLGEGC